MSVLYEKASHRHRLVIYPMDASEYKQLQLATQAPTRLMVHGMYIHLKQSQYQSVWKWSKMSKTGKFEFYIPTFFANAF